MAARYIEIKKSIQDDILSHRYQLGEKFRQKESLPCNMASRE
ncbi:hypothetical protein ACSPAB_20715 [Buttiauxella agrestis]